MPTLTPAQIKARGELVEDFRRRIKAAVWEWIEAADQRLLCADDGTPYRELVMSSLGVNSLEQMVDRAALAACRSLVNWL